MNDKAKRLEKRLAELERQVRELAARPMVPLPGVVVGPVHELPLFKHSSALPVTIYGNTLPADAPAALRRFPEDDARE